MGDEKAVRYKPPATGSLRFLNKGQGGDGGETTAPQEGGGGGFSKSMYLTIMAAAQRKAQHAPPVTIQACPAQFRSEN